MRVTRRRLLASSCAVGGVGIGIVGHVRHTPRGTNLWFDDSVDEATRTRCRRVEQRVVELTDRSLDAPVQVRFDEVDPTNRFEHGDRFDRAVATACHVRDVSWPDEIPGPRGSYNPGSRTMRFADPATVDHSSLDDLPDEIPDETEWYPPEPLIAHEFTHAIQYDVLDSIPPADQTRDAYEARQAVTEGAADYVAGLYKRRCQDGTYEPCTLTELPLSELFNRRFVVAGGGQRYLNGRGFVATLADQGGWEAVWAVHRSPPAATVDTTFPDRYLQGPTDPVDVGSPPEMSRNWLDIGSDRLGVAALYTKLYALGVVSLDDPAASVDPDVAEATTYRHAYRTPLLREWAGDRFWTYGYVDDLDRFGAVWRTNWRTEAAAEHLETAIVEAYDDRGRRRSGRWEFDGTLRMLRRDGNVLTFMLAKDGTGAEELFEGR